jgi:hypothetical protein
MSASLKPAVDTEALLQRAAKRTSINLRSTYKGVSWSKGNRAWRCRMTFKGRPIDRFFSKEDDAAKCYDLLRWILRDAPPVNTDAKSMLTRTDIEDYLSNRDIWPEFPPQVESPSGEEDAN